MIENNYVNLSADERGDYQTPNEFTGKICKYISEKRKINPNIIVEPTFGIGNFIEQSISNFNSIHSIYGIEISKKYFDYTQDRFANLNKNFNLYNESIFDFDFENIKSNINKEDKILIIGNPPWVTNTELETKDSINLPEKKNIKKLNGFDALTGKSNFDIAEYIILQLIEAFQGYNCTIAMLCKNIVVKNLIRDLKGFNFNINNIEMVPFEAKEVFGVSCDASLLIFDISEISDDVCKVYNMESKELIKSFGWHEDVFISDIEEYKNISSIDGCCTLEWRQGIKHDCSKIMQLKKNNNNYINGLKEEIVLEDNYVYPMLKSSDIKNIIINESRVHVIVTQQKVRQDTSEIEYKAPKLWRYLQKNSDFLDSRKSSIYKNSPRFSIFGVGDYSFKPFKVCVSGFYKEPIFSLAFREDKKPIMLDDTCYFIGFDNYKEALITTILLNSDIVQNFLKSIAFLDAKRPYTKEILMRIDFKELYNIIDYMKFTAIKESLRINDDITMEEYIEYYNTININT